MHKRKLNVKGFYDALKYIYYILKMQQEKLRPVFAALSRHSFMNTKNRSKTDSASPSGASDSHSASKPTKKHREGRRNWLGLRSTSKLTNSTGKRQIKDKPHQAIADPLAGKLGKKKNPK